MSLDSQENRSFAGYASLHSVLLAGHVEKHNTEVGWNFGVSGLLQESQPWICPDSTAETLWDEARVRREHISVLSVAVRSLNVTRSRLFQLERRNLLNETARFGPMWKQLQMAVACVDHAVNSFEQSVCRNQYMRR